MKRETVELAYKESIVSVQTLTAWFVGLDAKIVTVFTASSVIVTLGPTIRPNIPHILFGLTAVAWGLSTACSFVAFRLREFSLDPNPAVIFDDAWLDMNPDWYAYYRLRDTASVYLTNRKAYREKLLAVQWSIAFAAIEVALLAAALLW